MAKENKTKEEIEVKSKGLAQILHERGERVSKASRVRSLLQKQKGLWKSKQTLTDFKEPVLDLYKNDGTIETYENATLGKFVFTHSNGKERYAELRPSDQYTRDYAGKKVRWYNLHEDRPYAGYETPIVDGETMEKAFKMAQSTNLKYEESLAKIGVKNKQAWLYILGGVGLLIAIGAFAYSTWIQPALAKQALETANSNLGAVTGSVALFSLKSFFKKGKMEEEIEWLN